MQIDFNFIFYFLFIMFVSYFYLKYLTSLYQYQKLDVKKKLKTRRGIRWGVSLKSHYGGSVFSISIILMNIFLIFFKTDFYFKNTDIFFVSLIILLASFFGFLDEKHNFSPIEKFFMQFLIVFFLLFNNNIINISSIHYFNIFFSLIYYILIINVINFFDNIDLGLSSFTLIILFFLFYIYFSKNDLLTIIIITIIASIIPFIFFNKYPSKIFMGDIGSFQIAIILLILTINLFWDNNQIFNGYKNAFYNFALQNLFFVLPIFDFFIVSFKRFILGKSLLIGDTNHLSHVYIKFLKSPNYLAVYFAFLSSISCLTYFYFKNHAHIYKFTLLFLFYVFFFIFITCTYIIIDKNYKKLV